MDGALVLDVILEFAAPFDEGGFGDFQFFGNTGEAPAFAAELHKALLGGDVVRTGGLWQMEGKWGSEVTRSGAKSRK